MPSDFEKTKPHLNGTVFVFLFHRIFVHGVGYHVQIPIEITMHHGHLIENCSFLFRKGTGIDRYEYGIRFGGMLFHDLVSFFGQSGRVSLAQYSSSVIHSCHERLSLQKRSGGGFHIGYEGGRSVGGTDVNALSNRNRALYNPEGHGRSDSEFLERFRFHAEAESNMVTLFILAENPSMSRDGVDTLYRSLNFSADAFDASFPLHDGFVKKYHFYFRY